jgi:hypothetical protein
MEDRSQVNELLVGQKYTRVTLPDLITRESVYSFTVGRSNHFPLPPLVETCTDGKPSKPGGGVAMIVV